MAQILIKTAVEASPELIADQLRKYAATTADAQFTYPRGTLIELKPEVVSAVNGAEGMPALVIQSALGSPLGIVAVHKIDGDITVLYIGDVQVVGEFKFAKTEVPAGP